MKRRSFIIFLIVLLAAIFPAKEAFASVTWVSNSPLPPAYVGAPYSYQLQATSVPPPTVYTIVAGSLPGLSLSPSGLISGTVTTSGTATVTIRGTDSDVSTTPQSADRTFTISYLATGVTGPLRIKRLQIQFDNNRPEITIVKNQSPPQVSARLSFIGSGLLQGYWAVDGAIHSRIQQTLISGANTVLVLPTVPPLPTYQTGGHRIQLVVTEPVLGTIPEAIYYVTEKGKKEAFVPIKIISPPDRLDVDFSPLSFSWQLQKDTTAYLIEFFEPEDQAPIFSAYTREARYTIPTHSLSRYFSEKSTYLWRIKGFSKDNDMTNESTIHRFNFR